MEGQKTSNMIRKFMQWSQRMCNDNDETGSQSRPDGFTSESRILDIQSAKTAALIQQAERLCTAEKARNNAVLERMGLCSQDVTHPSPQPPRTPKSSSQGRRRLIPLRDVPHLKVEHLKRNHKSPEYLDVEEDDSFWDDVLLGSQIAAQQTTQKADRGSSPTASISVVSSLSSVDTHTPSDLRAISLMGSPVEVTLLSPTPPPPRVAPITRRRVSRLPVFSSASGQSSKKKVEAIVENLERFQLGSIPSPRPPAAARKTTAVEPKMSKMEPLAPTPPTVPQNKKRGTRRGTILRPAKAANGAAPTPPTVPQNKKRGTRRGTILRPAKAANGAVKKTTGDRSLQTGKDKKDDLQPLSNPVESLSLSFRLLSSDDWMKKTEGMKIIQALARYNPDILTPKLHEVCLALIEEVNNLRSVVSCAAMNTLGDMYRHLQKTMDPEAERTGRALLLKLASTTNAFIHQQVNLALDAMVENCSHGRNVTTLVNTGLSHRCVAVRGSMAQHLHQVAESCGSAHILTAGRCFTERFLIAVSKMLVDGAPEVRHPGQMILQKLALHKDFMDTWARTIPEKDRRPLDRILKAKK
ncbi:hypothetical protein PAMP_006960 [Pampus punctatissimus]